MAGAEVPTDERRRAQPGRTEPGSLALSFICTELDLGDTPYALLVTGSETA